ncbi:MAG: UbiA prenyltransferase family protein [Candidatus Woesearchaeota archaeon]
MTKIKELLDLIRVRQWYKNIVIFLPIFFVTGMSNWNYLYLTAIGFVSLCLLSSGNYIINDLVDLRKDQLHPEKKNRPLANGKISKLTAVLLTFLLLALSLIVGLTLPLEFIFVWIALLTLTQLYTFWLKDILFADILTISTLFVLRAVAGAVAINVKISPWLILCPFFLALFLAVGKRHSDLILLKGKGIGTRKVLQDYTVELTNSLMVVSTTLLVISYALYSFLSEHKYLLLTLPFALFTIFRFYHLIQGGSDLARNPEKMIRDKSMILGMLLWIISTTVLIYGAIQW